MNLQDKIIEQICTTQNYTMHNGWSNAISNYGYHSFDLPGVRIKGQRSPLKRLEEFNKHINFNDKVVVDIGCNVGGMLHHLFDIKKGYGFDYDIKCVNAANNIAKILNKNNTEFYQFDFDKRAHNEVFSIIKEKIDIVFLLSIGKWISTHKDLYRFFALQGVDIVIELNNDRKNQDQIDVFRNLGLMPQLIIKGSPDDITDENKKYRSTYLIKHV
jgi:SAM-dependent methyltransferase